MLDSLEIYHYNFNLPRAWEANFQDKLMDGSFYANIKTRSHHLKSGEAWRVQKRDERAVRESVTSRDDPSAESVTVPLAATMTRIWYNLFISQRFLFACLKLAFKPLSFVIRWTHVRMLLYIVFVQYCVTMFKHHYHW